MRSNVLIITPHDAALSEYLKLCEASSHLAPFFYLSHPSSKLEEIKQKGWWFHSTPLKKHPSRKNIWLRFIKSYLDNSLLGTVLQGKVFKNYLATSLKRRLLQNANELDEIIKSKNISVIIISNDRSCGVEAAAQYIARESGIYILLLSFAYAADFESAYKLRAKKIYSLPWSDSESLREDPDLGSKCFYRPCEEKALKDLGVLSSNPWVLGQGRVNKMLVDSNREKQRLLFLGGKNEDYLVCGTRSHDMLFQALRNKKQKKRLVKEKYGLDASAIVIIALPQYWEHGLCAKDMHFKYIASLVKETAAVDVDVLLSLHPKMDRDNYRFLAAIDNVHLIDEPLSEVMPVCDVFVSTYSSTVAWALLCRVKVILVDHVCLKYTNFFKEYNLPVFYDSDSYAQFLSQSGAAFLQATISSSRVSDLSPFDGKCVQRIESAIVNGGKCRC